MFSWDPAKAEQNLSKHGISFVIGVLPNGRVIAVAYTRRIDTDGETTRIISARRASFRERVARQQQRPTDP